MTSMPEAVLDILMQRVLQETSAAWLLLDENGILNKMGGSLATFGLSDVKKGCVIQDQAVFLEGILSMEEPLSQIDSVQIDNGEYADVYSVEDDSERWVVMLGRTESSRWRGVAQQKSNELSLLQQKVSATGINSIDLSNLLGIIALEQNSNRTFKLLDPIPDCFAVICPEINNQHDNLHPEENFIFLENFLVDSRAVWEDGTVERLKSGPWIEVNQAGEEFALEATAILWKQRKILLIEFLDSDYQDHHNFLQHGRENELIKQALEKEISLQNIMGQKLIAARALADSANQAKSEFLSSMSHELRTPLNAILGFSQLLMSNPAEPLTEEQRENMGYILNSGNHLLELINQILDLSKIESGNLDLSIAEMAPGDVIKECLPLVQVLANKQQISLNYWHKAGIVIEADATQFRQVIINLLSNAVKYNTQGGRVDINELMTEAGRYRLQIKDEGIGIPKDRQDKLFTSFDRLGQEQSEIEGTGIGLAVTKAIVEAMDGEIGFESVVGEGSVFWIELPLLSRIKSLLET